MTDWISRSLSDIGQAFRAGKLSPLDLYEQARARHEKFGEALNAYRVWDETHARAQAEEADAAFRDGQDHGPLQGIPVSVKDLFGVDYLDTCAGSPNPLPKKWSGEGPVIKAVRAQCAVLTGKTHMVEFAFGGLGTNAHWPVPRNPWDATDHRIPGGSSSGAGVSLIEGSALVALGSDTAGSVRAPASITGTVGLKITTARWPLDGIVPLSPTLDTPGVLTRSVADAALAFEVIDSHCAGRKPQSGAEPADLASLRIGVPDHYFQEDCPDDIASAVGNAIAEIERAGAKIETFNLPEAEDAYELFRQGSVVASELRAFLESELPDWIDTLDPNITFRLQGALDLDSDEILKRRARIDELSASAAARMSSIDILVSPTIPVTAAKLADIADVKAYSAANGRTMRNTCIANILGLCAITLPVALDGQGIPVGLQCMAAGNTEDRLLSVALAVERTLGTAQDRLGKSPLGA